LTNLSQPASTSAKCPKLSVGDKVRIHYHPPGRTQSYVEGKISRVDVDTSAGRVFVVDVTYDVIHDVEQALLPGYQNYVLYERWEDFPGRIEMLLKAESQPAPEREPEPLPEEIARRDPRKPGNVIAAIFGRRG
jgi:hypothetical protein